MAQKLIKLSTYLRTAYGEGDAPDPRTVRAAIDRKEIAGERRGSGPKAHYWVLVDETGQAVKPVLPADIKPVNDIAGEILRKAGAR